MQRFENALQSGIFFENAVLVDPCGRGKMEVFENDDLSVLNLAYPTLQKAARKYAKMPKARAKLLYWLFILAAKILHNKQVQIDIVFLLCDFVLDGDF